LIAGRRRAPVSGFPTPAHERIVGGMLDDLREGLAAVALGILELFAHVPRRLADPRHAARREVPLGGSGDARQRYVHVLMATRALHAHDAVVRRTAVHDRIVQATAVAL